MSATDATHTNPNPIVLLLAACTCKLGLIGPHYMKEFCVGNSKRK